MVVGTRRAIVAYGLVIEMGHLILLHVFSARSDLKIICTGIHLAGTAVSKHASRFEIMRQIQHTLRRLRNELIPEVVFCGLSSAAAPRESSVSPAMIYHFIMRPLHPHADGARLPPRISRRGMTVVHFTLKIVSARQRTVVAGVREPLTMSSDTDLERVQKM